MKRKLRWQYKIIGLIILCLIFLVLVLRNREPKLDVTLYSEEYIGIEEIKEEMKFSIYTSEEWDTFFAEYPKNWLTGEMLKNLCQKLGVSEYVTGWEFPAGETISRKQWNQVYQQMLEYLDDKKQVQQVPVLVLQVGQEESRTLYTNQGTITTGLPESFFSLWEAYEVYLMGEECVGICQVSTEQQVIKNAYLKNIENHQLQFLFGEQEYQISATEELSQVTNGVCDLVFQNQKLVTLRMKYESIQGDLISYDDSFIEISGYGKIAHSAVLPVYQTYEEVQSVSLSAIVLGNMKVRYIVGEEEVCAIVLEEPAQIEKIRVLLLSDTGSKTREQIFIKSDGVTTFSCGTDAGQYGADTVIPVMDYLTTYPDEMFSISPDGEASRLYLCDAAGTALSNGYGGTLEVRKSEAGYTVVNQLGIEDYLYGVVPSEMPAGYEAEALKAQAVCARSYAYGQLLRGDLAAYGAHIDDSTSYQVYNRTAQAQTTKEAVDATRGQVLTYQGKVIEAYYFSTSMGYTDTAAVWNAAEDSSYGFLQPVCLNESSYGGDLSKEEDFLAYIQSQTIGYDSDIKFYRWQAVADFEGKTQEILAVLEKRHSISRQNVIYYEADTKTECDSPQTFGTWRGFEVITRSTSGCILSMRVLFEHGEAEISNEYTIRSLLGVGTTQVTFADGSANTQMQLLPSAFCELVQQEDGSYLIYGGGYGHGLGMSQNGANGMAKAGKSYSYILHFFYQGVELETIYE